MFLGEEETLFHGAFYEGETVVIANSLRVSRFSSKGRNGTKLQRFVYFVRVVFKALAEEFSENFEKT